jgi:hypothetical protein
MLRIVAVVRIDVSEERLLHQGEEINKLETTLVVTGN